MTTTTTLGAATLMGAILATAMSSGLMFCFAHSVMPGLGTLDDRAYLTAFQRIDAASSNPWMSDQPAAERRDPGRGPRASDAADLRSSLDGRWVRRNVVRAVTSTGALSALSWALFVAGRAAG